MIISIFEAKQWLKIDHDEEDAVIDMLIHAAEAYIKNATGNVFDDTNHLAKLLCLVFVTDWYENREMIGKTSEKIRPTVESIIAQLSHCYDTQEGDTG
ncbi:head-tail connector protein [Anoxybacillus thermarum]|uniref:head-tail connector protein n=1 Tax=Anoxybacillus TaxID=150247 RepID=UPI0005C63199|nr:head-tail connector protein [Anoxybacillus thermarum]